MANAIDSKRQQQTYLRQVNQEKAERKRELMNAQKNDIKAVRDFYNEQAKQLDSETAAAVNHIKEDARMMAENDKLEREEKKERTQEQKRVEREEKMAEMRESSSSARSSSVKSTRADDDGVETNPARSIEKKKSIALKA